MISSFINQLECWNAGREAGEDCKNKAVCYAKTIYFRIAYGMFFIMTFAGFDNDEVFTMWTRRLYA